MGGGENCFACYMVNSAKKEIIKFSAYLVNLKLLGQSSDERKPHNA